MHFLQPNLNPASSTSIDYAYGHLSVEDILQFLLISPPKTPGAVTSSSDNTQFVVIPGKTGARWIIPASSRGCGKILSSWRPYDFVSKLKWRAVELASSLNLLRHLPGVRQTALPMAAFLGELRRLGLPDGLTPVIQVGNPSSTRKLIVFLLSPPDVHAILKIPLTVEARPSIANEARALDQFAGLQPHVPRRVFYEKATGWLAQSWIEGDPSTRSFSSAHCDFLQQLVLDDSSTSWTRATGSLLSTYCHAVASGVDSSVMRAMEYLSGPDAVPTARLHGDFVPWNIKFDQGQLRIFDWESARFDGLPLQDICHFFYKQDFLFRDVGSLPESMLQHPQIRRYLDRFSLSTAAALRLVLYYLVDAYFFHFQHEEDALYQYDLAHIRIVTEAIRRLGSQM